MSDLNVKSPRMTAAEMEFERRLRAIQDDIELGMNCNLNLEWSESADRYYFQIECLRPDAITGELGRGYGGKGYVSEEMSDSVMVQLAFGLYKAYWEHEARETFKWRKRRVFGPHISTEALWEVARRVDVSKPVTT